MLKTCAQYVRNLLVSLGVRSNLSTYQTVFPALGAYKPAVTPPAVNTFTSYLYAPKIGHLTSVINQLYTLSTPPITTTSPVNKELFIIEQGA